MQSSSDVIRYISKSLPQSKLPSQNPELPNQEILVLLIQYDKELIANTKENGNTKINRFMLLWQRSKFRPNLVLDNWSWGEFIFNAWKITTVGASKPRNRFEMFLMINVAICTVSKISNFVRPDYIHVSTCHIYNGIRKWYRIV